jgi:hypothetical protein
VGATRYAQIQVTALTGELVPARVVESINAASDPELAKQLLAGTLNRVEQAGQSPFAVAAPVVYHDPDQQLLILVLGVEDRHREIAERQRLLERMAADGAELPSYARTFEVVFGPAALNALLAERAQAADHERRQRAFLAEGEARAADLAQRERTLANRTAELASWESRLGQREAQLTVREDDAVRANADLHQRAAAGAAAGAAAIDARGADLEQRRQPARIVTEEPTDPKGESRDEVTAPVVLAEIEPEPIPVLEPAAAAPVQAPSPLPGFLPAAAPPGPLASADQDADLRAMSTAQLIEQLDSGKRRLTAALQLCQRRDPDALPPLMKCISQMPRAEAVRVLGTIVRFGDVAQPILTGALDSSKAYIRHGCALALAMLRTESASAVVVDLLLREPTEIWREVARAVGRAGPVALMPLATRLGSQGDRLGAQAKERAAWAMAHIGVRGGKAGLDTLAGGASVIAPIAREALTLMERAAKDEVGLQAGTSPGREVTVNRAFSKRFFESLDKGESGDGSKVESSGPHLMLDDSDLMEADESDLEIEDSDIII